MHIITDIEQIHIHEQIHAHTISYYDGCNSLGNGSALYPFKCWTFNLIIFILRSLIQVWQATTIHKQPPSAKYLKVRQRASQIFIAGPEGQQNIEESNWTHHLKGYTLFDGKANTSSRTVVQQQRETRGGVIIYQVIYYQIHRYFQLPVYMTHPQFWNVFIGFKVRHQYRYIRYMAFKVL